MANKKRVIKPRGPGAPSKPMGERKRTGGLSHNQWDKLLAEVKRNDAPSVAFIVWKLVNINLDERVQAYAKRMNQPAYQVIEMGMNWFLDAHHKGGTGTNNKLLTKQFE